MERWKTRRAVVERVFLEEKKERKKESVIYVGGYVIFDAKFQICSKNKIVIQK